ncbi:MAG: GNAT family N-acetyltransferase [Peptococcaceae bacterium]|nr:GNAT family N-acetyltransferase [Peptococcaceae bacterium]
MLEMEGLQDEEIKLTLMKMLPNGHPDMGEMPILFFNIRLLDGTWIGQCDLRVGNSRHTDVLGHIGYGINENYRGHHYAEKACRLLMKYAKKANMPHVDITCNTDNIPSVRTCERLHAQLLGTIEVPPDNIEYRNGSRIKYRYRILLDDSVSC